MRRLLCLFLLLWFPLQMSWAAVAAYCQHEADPVAHHFGHHQHAHLADQGKQDEHGQGHQSGSDKKAASADNDCATCHFSAVPPVCESPLPVIATGRAWVRPISGQHVSHIPDGLERPAIGLAA